MTGMRITSFASSNWSQRMRLRGHLARLRALNPRLIADVGFSLEAADREIAKRFWQR